MTDRRLPTSDQFLVAWFEDGPTRMPDRVLDVVADRISAQRQRRAFRFPRRPALNLTARLATAAAAIVFLAVIGWSLLPRTGPGPGGQATPAPTPTATAAPTATPIVTQAAITCDGGTAGCLGPLAAGTYTAANFRPRLTFTVPAGWSNTYDPGRGYTLVPPGGGYSFQVLSEVQIPEQTQPQCNAVKKAGVLGSVADWVDFLTKNPGLTAKAPVPVTVGGYDGFRVDFARSASWTAMCPNSVGPAVMIWVRTGVSEQGRFTDDQQESFWVLDVGGSTVLITLDSSPDPAQHTRDIAAAQPVVDSFQFNP
jgi:hypothetical protein